MKKIFLAVMVILVVATTGCNVLHRSVDINGVHTHGLTSKENMEAFTQGQNNMDACSEMIKNNPSAYVDCGDVTYDGTAPNPEPKEEP